MNEGELASRLGLSGRPSAAETIMIERDLRLVELTGARYHVAQVTCKASVDVIRRAKQNGLPVTCGVSAPHLTLNENDVASYRTFMKTSPPLRNADHPLAVVRGASDGPTHVILSIQQPREPEPNRLPFAPAAIDAVGREPRRPTTLPESQGGTLPPAPHP